jgi:hypothetical protein
LKDYYTNLDLDIDNIKIDNSLLWEYIEDTCDIYNFGFSKPNFIDGIDDKDYIVFYYRFNFIKQLCCNNTKQLYFCNVVNKIDTIEFYCYFTNKCMKTNKIDSYQFSQDKKYKYMYVIATLCIYIYVQSIKQNELIFN